jgi:hypothetical protein
MVASGIRFNDYLFTEPRNLAEWVPPKYAGLFAILTLDQNWAPKPFQPLCFGEFGNNSRMAETVRGTGHLFIAVLPMPFSTTDQRSAARDQLIWAYSPLWQAKGTPSAPSELARKLEELEKKHEEQTTQFRLLLSNMNKLFEPQPDPPARRRSIGFIPQSDTAG